MQAQDEVQSQSGAVGVQYHTVVPTYMYLVVYRVPPTYR